MVAVPMQTNEFLLPVAMDSASHMIAGETQNRPRAIVQIAHGMGSPPWRLVLDYVPMLKKNGVLDAKNVGCNPVRRLKPRKSSMDDHELALRHDRPGLVFQRRREALDEVEQSFAPRRDMSTVLDVVWRPKPLGRSVVTFVEQRIESLQHESFVLFRFRLHESSLFIFLAHPTSTRVFPLQTPRDGSH